MSRLFDCSNAKAIGLRTSHLRTARGLNAQAGRMFEALEERALLTVNINTAIGAINVSTGASASVIDLTDRYDDPALTGAIVRFNSVLGSFNIEMFDQPGQARTRTTPLTVANFMNYINARRYENTIIHRAIPGFVLQGGGFNAVNDRNVVTATTTFAAVNNEPGNTNIRGTIAMAKQGGAPNSATSQWFINLVDNSGSLDTQNGGFTAFGRVIGNGMTVVDALAAVPNFEFSEPFDNLPVRNFTQQDFNNGGSPRVDQLEIFSTIEEVPELTYTVSSSNSALVTPVIVGDRLVLNYGATGSGTASITFRITSADGSFVEDSFNVNVAATPATQGNLAVSSARIGVRGDPLTITATGTDFESGTLQAVTFFRDANGNGLLDVGTDIQLDVDIDGADGWSTTLSTSDSNFGAVAGGQILFAKGTLPSNSTVVVRAAISFNAAPVVGLAANSPLVVVNPGDNVTLNALSTFDRDGTVSRVQFYRDSNGNGTFESGTDALLGEDTDGSNGFSLTTATTGFTVGANFKIFMRATDNEGATSAAAETTLRVNSLPTVGSLGVSNATLTRGSPFVLTAQTVADADSARAAEGNFPAVAAINRVDFFRDSNGDGVLQTDTDQLLGSASTGTNGNYTFTLTGTVTQGFTAGTIRFFAQAVDGDSGRGAAATNTAQTANTAPTITSVAVSPAVVANLGATVTLTAAGAADSDGTINRVEFYRDANANSTYDDGVDVLLGSDSNAAGGYTLAVNTGNQAFGFAAGTARYFARAIDSDGAASAAVTITNRVNAAPTIAGVTSSPNPLGRNSSYTLTAGAVADTDGTIARVEFYRDTNGNGQLDVGTDTLLGSDTTSAGGYTFTGTATGFPLSVQFFARAVDNDNGVSTPATLTTQVQNSRPTITGITTSPSPLAQLGATVNLTATGVADADGTVQSVAFYFDADFSNSFDIAVDTLLGTDSSSAGGFTLGVALTSALGFGTGLNRIYAVATDNDSGTTATPAFVDVRINAVPTVGGLSGPQGGTVGRLQPLTLTATNVVDVADSSPAGTINRVEFYRDSNGNSQLDVGTDTLLGLGVRQTGTNTYVLTASTAGFTFGTNRFFVRAQDNNLGFSDQTQSTTTTVIIGNNAPTLTSVTASPNPLSGVGATLTLTAVGPADSDGTVARVRFYRDADGNGQLDTGVDILLGEDTQAAGGFALAVDTGNAPFNFAAGNNTYFAVAVDNDGATSTVRTTSSRVNAPPMIGGLTTNGPVGRLAPLTLTATGVVDVADSVAAGTIGRVEFYRDSNGNSQLDVGTDTLLGVGVRQTGTNTYVLTTATAGFTFGSNRFFVRAQDNNLGFSTQTQDTTATATISNNAPTLTSVTASPNPLTRLGATLTLTAVGPADRDGTIASVQFYRDADGNGQLDTGVDILLGTDTQAAGGFTLAVNTGDAAFNFSTGTNTYFAVATDNDGATSTVRTTSSRVNAPPVIGGFTTSGTTARLSTITLTATNVLDQADSAAAGTITRVEFYRDVNGNGTFEGTVDRLLGLGVRQTGTSTYVLTTATTGFSAGTNTFFVRAQDNTLGFSEVSVDETVTATITNLVPTLTSLTDTPDPVTEGQNVTLTALGAADRDGTIARVDFYNDVNNNGAIDAGVDILLGSDSSAVGGYTLAVNTSNAAFNLAVGNTNRYLAAAVDNDGGVSTGRTSTGRINAAPIVGNLATSGQTARGNTLTLTATNVSDTAEPGVTGTIRRVEFYLDTNGNQQFDTTDRLLGSDLTATAGAYSFTVSTAGFGLVPVFFARAVDNDNGAGTGVAQVARAFGDLVNNTPTLTVLTATPNPVTALGGTVTLTAAGQADRDGTIASVQFFRDNGDNVFDAATDTLLGSDTSAVGGYTLAVNTGDVNFSFATGVNRYFARAVDNDGGFSTPTGTQATTTGRVNARPTIGGVTTSVATSVARGANVTYTATNVVDTAEAGFTGTVTLVQFYRDLNGNGTIETTDRLLGSGVRQTGTNTFVLTASSAGFAVGSNTVLARATDNNLATSLVTSVSFDVTNANPLLTSTTVTGAPVAFLGRNITIVANGARDTDGTVSTVLFFFDTNGDGVLQSALGGDLLIGEDNSAVGGYSLTIATLPALGFTVGSTNRVFACVVDNDTGNVAVPATFSITATNDLPTIGAASFTNATVNRNSNATVTATTVADTQGVSLVEFYRDVNGNGTIEPNVDILLGSARPTANSASLTFSTRGFGTGATTVLARAQDTRLSYGTAVSATLTVNNLNPTVVSLLASPNPVLTLGSNLTLTASGVADADGTVASVAFYYDTDNSGTLDTGVDALLATDASAVGGFTTVVNTGNFSIVEGSRRFFARVTDNNGGVATAFVAPRINGRPLIDNFDVTAPVTFPPISRAGNFTLSLDATDDLGVTSVQIYRDIGPNFDNTFTAADAFLGLAVRTTGTNTWTFTRAGSTLPLGSYKLYARAVDSNGVFSAVSEIAVAVVA